MHDIWAVLGVAGLFLLRIGVPVLLMVLVGVLIDKWQIRNEAEIRRYYEEQTQEPVAQVAPDLRVISAEE